VTGTVDGKTESFDFPAKLVDASTDDSHAFVEKLWAIRRIGEIIDEIDLNGHNQELIDELVALAKKHGILTPYTSFLADERTDVHDLASVNREAGIQLRALQETTGESAFGQRLAKSQLQRASRAPTGSADSLYFLGDADRSSAAAAGGAAPVGLPAMPGMAGGPGQAGSPGDAPAVVTRPPRTVGKKTFYWRNQRWEDSALTATQLEDLQEIKLYSKEYFDLLARHGKDVAKYLATDDDIVVVLSGKAFALVNKS
jgi:Ca-activated chloride channel family protein